MARPVSIRRSLLGNLVAVIIVLSAAIMGTTLVAARRVVRTLSASLIMRSIDQTEARLRQFFSPVVGGLTIAASLGDDGLLSMDQPEKLNQLIVPLMKEYPQVSSAYIADTEGNEHMVIRTGQRWRNRQVRRGAGDDRAQWWEWTEQQPTPTTSFETIDYDPRRRGWFAGAVEMASSSDPHVHWTDPYTFFTTQDPGITASLSFDPPDDGKDVDYVMGFDVALSDISDFTFALRPSREGFIFVMAESGQLIGLPHRLPLSDPAARKAAMLKRPADLGIAELSAGAAAYFAAAPAQRIAYRFFSGGRAWWAGARPFVLGPDRTLLVVVAIPESDLLGHLMRLRLWIAGITAAVLAGAVWRAVVVSGRYSRPIEALVAQSGRFSRGDLEPGPPIESEVKEVGQLARAHDRMRAGLQSLLKLERDIQLARQIQERTFPDHLPALNGFEIDAWSEPADETGGDTYDVVGCRDGKGGAVLMTGRRAERVVLLMADATGHGIGPALSVTQVRAMLRMAVRAALDLPSIILHMNEQLCSDLPEGRFITAWIGELRSADRSLTCFSAGQAPILRYDASADSFEVRSADTLPLGVARDLDMAVARPSVLSPGDIVAVISDGIYEATDPAGTQFGADRVVEVIRARRRESPTEIIAAIRKAVQEFTAGAPAADDRTGIVIKGT